MYRLVIALVALGACNGDKDSDKTGDTGGGEEPSFSVLGAEDGLPAAALLSIWGTESDMWIVGSDDGTGPVVLHWDDTSWTRLPTGTTGDLWWVWSVAGSDKVWIGGDGARMLVYSRSAGTFTETVIADNAYTLFGLWGTSDTDIWAVGGDVINNLPGAIFHWDGTAWTQSTTVEPDGNTKRQAFKVWGSAADDVWVVGSGALVMHWDGAAWETLGQPVYKTTSLTTVRGTGPDDVYAVGGEGNATTAHWDGNAWSENSPPPGDIVPYFNGVFASAEFGVVACGGNGSIYWHEDTAWVADPRAPGTARDFHACWIDDAGAVWAVGGDLSSQTEGVVIYGGDHVTPISL